MQNLIATPSITTLPFFPFPSVPTELSWASRCFQERLWLGPWRVVWCWAPLKADWTFLVEPCLGLLSIPFVTQLMAVVCWQLVVFPPWRCIICRPGRSWSISPLAPRWNEQMNAVARDSYIHFWKACKGWPRASLSVQLVVPGVCWVRKGCWFTRVMMQSCLIHLIWLQICHQTWLIRY